MERRFFLSAASQTSHTPHAGCVYCHVMVLMEKLVELVPSKSFPIRKRYQSQIGA